MTIDVPATEVPTPPPQLRWRPRIRNYGRLVTYRIAGLPIVVRAAFGGSRSSSGQVIRAAFARQFWHPRSLADLVALILALVLWPFALAGLQATFLKRNGRRVAAHRRRSTFRQLLDQTRLYFTAGVLPPWYYIFELHRAPANAFAQNFIYRWESKGGVMSLLKEGPRAPTSILSDKAAFAAECAARGVATVPLLAIVRDGEVELAVGAATLKRDLFVKPMFGRGGKGAERWDFADGHYRNGSGKTLAEAALKQALEQRSLPEPLIIQPRLDSHPDLAVLANGALTTVRILTCLDEHGQPELVGAAMRMAIGSNRTVDNLHAGGIAAAIDLATGALGPASNLGADCRSGWMDRHPDSGATITGAIVPQWDQCRQLAIAAHRAFGDRVLIGWDIAPTAAGPVVIEGNGAPDLDIMQRFVRHGLMAARLGVLLAYHVSQLDIDRLPL